MTKACRQSATTAFAVQFSLQKLLIRRI